ncbi:MAG: hypothetical protein K9I71_01805 [Ignavibacteriales bacterium]|nr:hypothetical protein [Ignavibacteriales bacterium]MCF8314823.1 hypothetical protein [Ignavibacteriales bacterium]MCF8436228.1 hypothetical protein [Ignavibacteriales bacterium]
MGNNLEIERKFLIENLPEGFADFPKKKIKQVYVDYETDHRFRLREKDGVFIKTVKRGKGLVREESEEMVASDLFDEYWNKTHLPKIIKDRYHIPFKGKLIELDVFMENLSGLFVAEVEFHSVDESTQFEPPAWFGSEVTEDERFTNYLLALYGNPLKNK